MQSGMESRQEDHRAVHCFYVCSGSDLLGDLLGVSRFMECDPSVLSICPWIFLRVHCVSSLTGVSSCAVVLYYMLMRISCFGVVVSICQVIG